MIGPHLRHPTIRLSGPITTPILRIASEKTNNHANVSLYSQEKRNSNGTKDIRVIHLHHAAPPWIAWRTKSRLDGHSVGMFLVDTMAEGVVASVA